MRRVLITAAASPLPFALATALIHRPDVETVVLADARQLRPPPEAQTVSLKGGYADIRDAIWDHRVDTVIHGALSPDRLGDCSELREPDVIATMQVAAVAADLDGPVRSLVALSSTMRYPAHPGAPQFNDERQQLPPPREGSHAAALAEAEDYLLALAEQRPNLAVCVLRLADLIGRDAVSPLASLLSGALPPKYIGFDPLVQFLHIDDAVAAIDHAVDRDLAGTFNVASPGTIRWSRAIGQSRPVMLPVLPPTFDPFTAIRRLLRVDPVPRGLAQTLQFGRVAATDRFQATGFVAGHSTEGCVGALRSSRRASVSSADQGP